MAKYTYTMSNGKKYTSNLERDEFLKRLIRLDVLRVLTEGYEEGHGVDVCKKAWRAYSKLKNFTGIIRLTDEERDWLSYQLESEFISDEDIECVKFYCHIKD